MKQIILLPCPTLMKLKKANLADFVSCKEERDNFRTLAYIIYSHKICLISSALSVAGVPGEKP